MIQQVTIKRAEPFGLWEVAIYGVDDELVQIYFVDAEDARALSELLQKASSMIVYE